jgi:hypothetical protein
MRWMRTLVVIAVVGARLVVSASSAHAAGTILVTPSTGLADGDVVTASGLGWNPFASIGICQAVPHEPVGIDNCGAAIRLTGADGDGNWSDTFQVSQFITVGSQTIDCAAPSALCVIAAADGSDIQGTAVWQTTTFAPAHPRILPGVGRVDEGNSGTTNLEIPVALSYASTDTITVQWATTDQDDFCFGTPPADPANDYTAASGTLTFAPGVTSEKISISVNGDTLVAGRVYFGGVFEPDERDAAGDPCHRHHRVR